MGGDFVYMGILVPQVLHSLCLGLHEILLDVSDRLIPGVCVFLCLQTPPPYKRICVFLFVCVFLFGVSSYFDTPPFAEINKQSMVEGHGQCIALFLHWKGSCWGSVCLLVMY